VRAEFGAYVVDARFERSGAVFACADGTVRFEAGTTIEAHPDAAALCAALHPSGDGLITGGDDGRLVWTSAQGATELAQVQGRWIDAVDSSGASGLIAFSAGKSLHVLDVKDAGFSRRFEHPRSVAGIALDAKGRRIACATYGGAALWFARIAEQKPHVLAWPGAHVGVIWSPDGRFLISAMQENALHGWRLSDAKDMRMGGYPAKIKSMVFLAKGALMATSGAGGAVVWPFRGSNGPMGEQAAEIAPDEGSTVVRAAAAPDRTLLSGGTSDGRIWVADLAGSGVRALKAEKGPAITALSMSARGDRLAWGDGDGGAGVFAL
jgi:WD40 repeat protein